MKRQYWIALAIGAIVLGATKPLMYGFNIKPGVYGSLQPVMDNALDAVQQVWSTHTLRPTITSIADGQHMQGSKHYQGLAFDVRLNDIPLELHETLRREVSNMVGSAFDVLHEYHGTTNDHLHIEFDPK